MSVRTTLTLDDDVAARLEREARRTGRSFKQTVNDAIRTGLDRPRPKERQAIELPAFDLGVRPGFELDDVQGLLDQVEGPDRR